MTSDKLIHIALMALCALLLGIGKPAKAADNAPIPGAPELRIEAGMHTAMIRRIGTDAKGRFAVTSSIDKSARVWDVASGRLLRVLRPPLGAGNEGKLYAVAISPDGALVAVGGWTDLGSNSGTTVYLFERASGKLVRRLRDLPSVINHLAFSPDGRWLALTLGGGNGVRVWDWQKAAAALRDGDYGKASHGASWSADGRLAVTSLDGKLRLYQVRAAALGKLAEVQTPGGKQPLGVAFAPDGQSLAVGYNDTQALDVFDGKTLTRLFSPDTRGVDNGNLSKVAWSRDGQTLVAGGMWDINGRYPVRRWPKAGRGRPVDNVTTQGTIMDLATLPGGGWLLAAADPVWGVLGADNVWRAKASASIADLRASRGDAFLLDDTGQCLQFAYELQGKLAHQFDFARRALRSGSLPTGVAPRVRGLALTDWENNFTPKLNGKRLTLEPNEIARSVAITADASGFVLGADFSLRMFASDGQQRWEQAAPGQAWGVNIPAKGRVVVAAYGDGTIRWHRLTDGKEVLALFPHADRKRWVLWTPSGYYDASPGGEDLIGWHVNQGNDQAAEFFPASRFRDKFYRPDVIDLALETLDETKALAQADQNANHRWQQANVALALPPLVEILSAAEFASASTTVTLRVRGRSAGDAPVTAWRVRVNGQASQDGRGLGRQDGAGPDTGERELRVNILPQDSDIQVFAESRHGVSTPASVHVLWRGEQAPTEAKANAGDFQIRPKLYLLAVGVAQYRHIAKLELTAKDARDFANAMQQQGKLYREVEVKLLTDGEATADAVVDGLKWLQKQVTQHDIGMVFIAGHGITDDDNNFSFLSVDADPARLRRTSVAMEEFKNTLANLPGKALFFFDTVHSGNVPGAKGRKGRNTDVNRVINELISAENGVVVFSASTGRERSYEDPALGNGAFTKALVEGINGAADGKKTGRVTHKMLDLYISERMKELTKDKQHPATQAPGGVPDFPLAVTK